MREKKIPIRKCVISGEQLPKKEMFRIVRTPDGEVVIDTTGKTRGHGAYLKKDEKVILSAQKSKSLSRHLEVEIPNEIFTQLLSMLGNENE